MRISIEYRIPVENYAEFTRAIHQLRGVRLRDGAVRWGIYRDAIDPEHLNETFIMESWLDYLRSRERMTAADEVIRARVRALHQETNCRRRRTRSMRERLLIQSGDGYEAEPRARSMRVFSSISWALADLLRGRQWRCA